MKGITRFIADIDRGGKNDFLIHAFQLISYKILV